MLRRREILSAALVVVTLCPMLLADKAERQKRRAEKRAAKSASTESESASYLRLLRNDQEEPVALQTSVVRFAKSKKQSRDTDTVIDLIGAVHIGDKNYYQTLNKLFEDYDVLLFELVAPEGTVPTPAARAQSGGNPISMMQSMTKDMLNLDSQLELVDYTPKNFVHADMSPSEMAKRMEERGDTGVTVALSAVAEIMRQANAKPKKGAPKEINPLELLTSMRDPAKMKRLMAQQFVDTGALDTGLGSTLNRMIVTDRNEAVMKILERERAKGHRKIGVFYGAAHMPDFEKRIAEQYGMKPGKPQWLTAWDLTDKANPKKQAEDPIEALLNLLGS